MRRRTGVAAILGALALWATAGLGAQEGASLSPGTFAGALEIPGTRLPLVLHLTMKSGNLEATLDSPSQGSFGIQATSVTVKGNRLMVELKGLGAKFEAEISPEGSTLKGTWAQGGAQLPLTLVKDAVIAGPPRPQTPRPPFPYRSENVALPGGAPGVTLAGTLCLPAGPGPFPAVLLITGSGPQDRDETILGHRPFFVIADYLARRGIASLRLDDRGVGASTGDFAAATTLDFAADARAALGWLGARAGVDPRRLGLVGHSEGGMIAPLVASEDGRATFVVLLAGPGLTGRALVLDQSAAIMRASGATEAAIAATRKVNEELYDLALGDLPRDEARSAIVGRYRAWAEAQPGFTEAQRSAVAKAAEQNADALLSPWMRGFLAYDPRPALAALRVPLLSLIGAKDLQVPAASNQAAIRAALGIRAQTLLTALTLPGLNHLFQHAGLGLPSEYGALEETFAPEALAAMGDWILSPGVAGAKAP